MKKRAVVNSFGRIIGWAMPLLTGSTLTGTQLDNLAYLYGVRRRFRERLAFVGGWILRRRLLAMWPRVDGKTRSP